jgi:hypothetical protein
MRVLALIIHLLTAVFAGLMYVCTLQLHMQVRSFRRLYLAHGKNVDTSRPHLCCKGTIADLITVCRELQGGGRRSH